MYNYQDPNLNYEALLEGASEAPWEVEENLVLPLIMLETPEGYAHLQKRLIIGWIKAGLRTISLSSRQRYACECAESALDDCKSLSGSSDAPVREAIQTARCFLDGLTSEEERYRAEKRMETEIAPWKVYDSDSAVFWAINAALGAVVLAGRDDLEVAAGVQNSAIKSGHRIGGDRLLWEYARKYSDRVRHYFWHVDKLSLPLVSQLK